MNLKTWGVAALILIALAARDYLYWWRESYKRKFGQDDRTRNLLKETK